MTKSRRTAVLALVAFVVAGCAGPGTGPTPGAGPDSPRTPSASPAPGRVVRTAGCSTATSPPATAIDGTPQPANQEYLDGVAGRLRPFARAHFPDVYSGLELRSEQNRLRVYRKPSAAFDAWLLRAFASECVEAVDAPHSERELGALAGRVSADMDYWRKHGVPVSFVSAKGDGTDVEVGTTDVVRAKREFTLRYGAAAPLSVVYGEPPRPA